MKTNEKLGVWMDHAEARLMPYSAEKVDPLVIRREMNNGRHRVYGKEEKHAHHKMQQQQEDFYEAIIRSIQDYPEVLLFGPTSAKQELYNQIRKKPHLDKMKIKIENCQRMSDNEIYAFIKNRFKPIAFGSL